jgi:hypothetical protein
VRIARAGLFAIVILTVPFLHHGHIEMFISDVRRKFERMARARGSRITQASSRLSVAAGVPSMRYEVAVRRKTRAVETSLYFEGSHEDVDQWLQLLAEHAGPIRAALGSGVEPERLKRTAARLRQVQVITDPDDDWSPKRDLTQALVDEVSGRLSRFVRVLDPIVGRKR